MPATKKTVEKKNAPAQKALAAKKSSRDVLEKVMVAVATNIIMEGLGFAWPYIQQAIEQIGKFERSSVDGSLEPKREDLLAGFLALLSKLGLEGHRVRDVATSFGLSAEELGDVLGERIARSLVQAEPYSFDNVLADANAYGLKRRLDSKLPVRNERTTMAASGRAVELSSTTKL